jgi:hypothetical protein
VLLIDRNAELPPGHRYRVGSPARCLAGMVRRAGSAGVNLAGLFRVAERNAQQEPPQTQLPEPIIEPQSGPLAHLTARLMASMERGITSDG